MKFLQTGLFIALASLMAFSGCSDLFQKDVKDNGLESNKFKADCELNIDEFALIMEEEIDETIDCLGKNLKLFVRVVESKKRGYLSRIALENFIKRNRKDIKPEVLRALKSVFDINYLIYGENPDFISVANINALVKFAKIFNQKAALNFKPIFMSKGEIDYDNYDKQRNYRIKTAALEITSALGEIFHPNSRNGEVRTLDMVDLLDSFTTVNNENSISKVKKLLFVKKVLLGGSKFEINHLELQKLIHNFAPYTLLALDGVRLKHVRVTQHEMIKLLQEDVNTLKNLVFPGGISRSEFFFSMSEAMEAAKLFINKKDFKLSDYEDLIKEAKLMIMGGNSQDITGSDFFRLLNHGLNVLNTGIDFHKYWSNEVKFLENPERTPIPANYQFSKLRTLYPQELKRIDDFSRILKKYRFLKGENISAFYTDKYFRNPDAVFEVAMYEYGLKLVMKRFGCPNNTLNNKVECNTAPTAEHMYMKDDYVYMTKDHVVNLVMVLRKALLKAKLILPGRENKTADTITLLGSLFQYQSDENKVFDVNEATEFAISLFTSIDISKDVEKYFLELIEAKDEKNVCSKDSFGRIEPGCFKRNFFRAVCLNYPDQFPKLFASLGATIYRGRNLVCDIPAMEPNAAFLQTSINAARSCNYYPSNPTEEVYFSTGDMMTTFLAMMHIETTILRWDVRDLNNKMDPAEVMDAYSIYSPALDGFLEKMPSIIKKLKKQIFQYLVKYEQVPDVKDVGSIWKFAKFLLTFNKDASANRKTIASILVTISEQGEPSAFDCDCLKNPNTVEKCQAESEARTRARTQAEPSIPPVVLTHSDFELMESINRESDSRVKRYLENNFWNIFGFLD